MKNKWGRSLLAGLLCFAMMLTVVCVEPTYTHASVKEAESDTAPVTLTNATFKVLKRGESLPIYEDLLVWRDWTTVGTGKSIHNDRGSGEQRRSGRVLCGRGAGGGTGPFGRRRRNPLVYHKELRK